MTALGSATNALTLPALTTGATAYTPSLGIHIGGAQVLLTTLGDGRPVPTEGIIWPNGVNA